MSLGEHTRPGLWIIEPCLPSAAKVPSGGCGWIHEIKPMAFAFWRSGMLPVRLITRAGNDFSRRFPFIATAFFLCDARPLQVDLHPDYRQRRRCLVWFFGPRRVGLYRCLGALQLHRAYCLFALARRSFIRPR